MPTSQYTVAQPSLPDVRDLLRRKDRDLLNELLEMKDLDTFVQGLPADDFFRLIKRIGPDDAVPVLAKATTDQWQYLLDLEVWSRDLLDTGKLMVWLDRLIRADAGRLARWISSEQGELAIMILLRRASVLFKEQEEEWQVPPGYFTLDGCFYIKAHAPQDAPLLERFLRAIASEHDETYRSLLLDLAAHLPSETEEELYRLRSNRLMEYGFAPPHEAIAVYAPLSPEVLSFDPKPLFPGAVVLPEHRHLIPASPISGIEEFRFLMEAVRRLSDPAEEDRVRVEFTTLCNTLIAANSFDCVDDYESLTMIGRQAAGYLHLALQKLCGLDVDQAARLIRDHTLMTIFRVGYGFAVDLKHRVKRWREQSFWGRMGKTVDFWDSPWKEAIEGLCPARPMFFDRAAAAPGYRPFESTEDLKTTERLIHQAEALDRLLGRLTITPTVQLEKFYRTFHPLLFNRWARHLLDMEPSFDPLTKKQARQFFRILRRGEKTPPFKMEAWRQVFMDEFLKGSAGFEAETAAALHDALTEVWQAFRLEYENVHLKDLDARWSKYLILENETQSKTDAASTGFDEPASFSRKR
jgi:hypothetical protein